MKHVFLELLSQYTVAATAETLWQELELAYTHKNRYYHNLTHLQNMYAELAPLQLHINDWDTVLLALFYHDVVYSATKNDNELKSSKMAISRLRSINFAAIRTSFCHELIMATKHHETTGNNDIDLFTDADLSILGMPWPVYEAYCKGVRNEYSIYPDIIYNAGRRKVLQHFAEKETIFKTNYFKERFEDSARLNISKEIKFL